MDDDIEKNSADNVSGSISKRNQKLEAISQDFGFLGTLSIAYGAAACFCLYHNPLGITVPLLVAVTYGAMFLL